jgi:phosphonate transport system substrate-binding protein
MSAITLALVPSATPGDSRFALDALCVALTKLLDRPVDGINAASYQDLASELEKDRVDYAWMSPTLMMFTNERVQLRPLLSSVRNERTDYSAALFVDAARSWYSLDDVRGSTIAWVDPTSASGYLFPRMHMASRGHDPTTFFGKELFLRSHADVVRAVIEGRADVGATYGEMPELGEPVRRAGFIDVAPEHPIRVIEWTASIPNDMIVGRGLISKPEHRLFANAVLTLAETEKGKRLLRKAFAADTFTTTLRTSLQSVQDLVNLARRNGVLPHL